MGEAMPGSPGRWDQGRKARPEESVRDYQIQAVPAQTVSALRSHNNPQCSA